ncbi:MAG: protease inhibitor I42 family protein [Acetobacteraceae bacterium]|nr:protease inhibitor I42 family protein [Acetobacteraceae bacterium]
MAGLFKRTSYPEPARGSKPALGVALALGLAVLLALCAGPAGCGRSTVFVSADASGTAITLRPGQRLVVELPSNPSTGFQWTLWTPPDATVLAPEGSEFVAPPSSSPAVGQAGKELWQFSATAQGKTGFTLAYARPWESRPPESEFTLSVEVR